MDQAQRLTELIGLLLAERGEEQVSIPQDEQAARELWRALVNVRLPHPADEAMLELEDAYLQEELANKQVVDAVALPEVKPGISIWQGDITLLHADVIVNAANNQMLGCFAPGHSCIDNAIHTFAGMRLRLACNALMQTQGGFEPTGRAKLTPAFNLPSRWVAHTVGPIVEGELTDEHRKLLASCYTTCLDAAREANAQSIAFCCISTGVFHFPNEEAARIAIDTVQEWRTHTNSQMKVIFNVFKQLDYSLYHQLLAGTC